MALTATGVGSGLDIEGLVTKLMQAERAPKEQRLLSREADVTNSISGLASLKGALSDLQTSLAGANSLSTFQQKNASSSQATAVGVTASKAAPTGAYSVSVEALARNQSLAVRNVFSTTNETVGTGTLTFTFGTTGYTSDSNNANDTYDSFAAKAGVASTSITINNNNNSLTGIRDAINDASFGVTAAIVKNGAGYQLLISSDDTGVENSVQISVSDSGDSNNTDVNGLSRLAFNASAGTTNVYQTVSGSDAAYKVNGLSLTNPSNIVTNVIDGLTLTLNTTTTSSATVSVTENTSGIKAAINTFVAGYNGFIDTVDDLTGYNFATKKGGALQGDFTALSTLNRVRATLGAAANGYSGTYTRLAEIGISADSEGKLSVDDTKLTAALSSSLDNVAAVLTRFAEPSAGSGIRSVSVTDSVAKGSYAVAVSSMATSGSKSSSNLSAANTINSGNDTLKLTIDGVESGTITLAQQSYASLSALATELQAKINADTTLRAAEKGASVSVVGSTIKISSNSVGSTSSIKLNNGTGDSTLTTLGFDTNVSTNGADLVGTINGLAGTSAGNILIGAVGSATVGLSMEITSTAGGTVTVSQGVMDQLDTLLVDLLGDGKGLDSRIDSLESKIEDIGEERLELNKRLDATEARFRRQFNALDSLVNQLTSTGSFVSAQLANIPIPGKKK
ncbi:MAG: flagellar filament capping protein FliD [Luminiphilus sp.]|nr:flagellar filament capping protein FliD [Luminiphilus sp.]